MTKSNRINIITLGCSKNTVDSERLMNQIKSNNLKLTSDAEKSDIVIINTCGFIESAKEESINTIMNAIELKNKGKIKKVIVTGCLSERYENEIRKNIPEVDAVFGTESYEQILNEIGAKLKFELLGEREITTPKHLAYLKISEGCNNPCSFCAIPMMRGMHKSFPMENLIEEANFLAKKNVKELVIIGQDTTDYGIDIYGKRNLAELLKKLSEIESIEWIRLMYAYPSHFPEDLIEEIKTNSKICKYIDIPLQHISDDILKSMRRGITKRRTIELLNNLRDKIPDIVLRTTFIVGYPNETDKHFEELCEFIKQFKFDRVGVFSYSSEENTPSFILGNPISKRVQESRKNRLMEIQKEISYAKNKSLINKELKVILESKEGNFFVGRSFRDAPEVDGEVLIDAHGEKFSSGKFYNVRIYDCNEYDLFANFINEKSI